MSDYEEDLCTVAPSIFKLCKNDWISKNGTCYEDSCCMSLEIAKTWHYRLSQLSHIIFSFLGICIVSIYIFRFSSKHILPQNIRFMVYTQLTIIVIHSVDMCIIHFYHLYRSLIVQNSNPCEIRVLVDYCTPYRYTFSICVMGLCFCQYAIYADRIICIYFANYQRHQKIILSILIIQITGLSFGTIIWVYREQDSGSYLLSCLNVPLASMEDLQYMSIAIFPINIICFFLSIFIFRIFENKHRKSHFDISRHFTASVDVDSSEFLYRVTGTQAVFICLYPVFSISVRFFYDITPRPLHLTLATLSYIFSIYSTVVPIIMITYARNQSKNRKDKIWSHVKLKSVGLEGADNYFNSLKSQWE